MAKAKSNGVEIEYETFGDPKDAPILLIMGLGAQLTRWSASFCEALAANGHHVIRYDNRDVGLSEKFDHAGFPNFAELFAARRAGRAPSLPYALDDMAADAAGLLSALGIARAHIVGPSMGGMIGQLLAADHADRVLSFTSIMSTTGNPALPRASDAAAALFTAPAPDPVANFEAYVAHGINSLRVVGSPAFPEDDTVLRARVIADYERAYYPIGAARQYAAVMGGGDRREKLRGIKAPVIVLHGEDDPLVPLAGGRDTHENIPGSELITVPGMGHNIPDALAQTAIGAIMRAVSRAG